MIFKQPLIISLLNRGWKSFAVVKHLLLALLRSSMQAVQAFNKTLTVVTLNVFFLVFLNYSMGIVESAACNWDQFASSRKIGISLT